MRRILVLLALGMLAGCGSPRMWVAKDATPEQADQDLRLCRKQADRQVLRTMPRMERFSTGAGTDIDTMDRNVDFERARAEQEFDREVAACMKDRGYTLQVQ